MAIKQKEIDIVKDKSKFNNSDIGKEKEDNNNQDTNEEDIYLDLSEVKFI